jgi:LemA protein
MIISSRTALIAALLLAAIVFFWATGAHNRLVALRNAVAQAAQRLAELLAQRAAAHQQLGSALQPALQAEQGSLAALADAVQRSQLASKALAAQPLDPAAARELVAAEALVSSSAARVLSLLDQHPGLSQQDGVQQPLQAWQQAETRLPLLRQAFSDAAIAHDAALAQFPTRLLAPFFRFSAAGRL